MTDGENRQKPQDNMYIVYDYEGFVDLRLPVNRKLYPSNADFFCNILWYSVSATTLELTTWKVRYLGVHI